MCDVDVANGVWDAVKRVHELLVRNEKLERLFSAIRALDGRVAVRLTHPNQEPLRREFYDALAACKEEL